MSDAQTTTESTKPDPLPVLEWAEKHGLENLKMHLETFSLCTGHINTLFNVLLVGAGGSLAYAAKLLEVPRADPVPALPAAAGWVCGYLTILAILVVVIGMRPYKIETVYNEPANLAQLEWSKEQLLPVELNNLQQRILAQSKINEQRARHLTGLRLLACAAPFVALVAALYYR